MKRWHTTALTLATTCMIGAPAFAQSDADARRETSSTTAQQRMSDRDTQQYTQTIEGQVVGLQTVRNESGDRQVLARIETEDGVDRIVSLGSLQDYRDQNINLSVGQDVTVRGSIGTLQGSRIFTARQLETDDRTFSLTSSAASTLDTVGRRATLPDRPRANDPDPRSAYDRKREHFSGTDRGVAIDPVDLDNIVRQQRNYGDAADDNRYTDPDQPNKNQGNDRADQRSTRADQRSARAGRMQGSTSYDTGEEVQPLNQAEMSEWQRRQNIIDRAQDNRYGSDDLRDIPHIDADDRSRQQSRDRAAALFEAQDDEVQPLDQTNLSEQDRRQQILQHAQRVRSGRENLQRFQEREDMQQSQSQTQVPRNPWLDDGPSDQQRASASRDQEQPNSYLGSASDRERGNMRQRPNMRDRSGDMRSDAAWRSDREDQRRDQMTRSSSDNRWSNEARGSIDRESDLRVLAFGDAGESDRIEQLRRNEAQSADDLRNKSGEVLVRGEVQNVRTVQFRSSGETHTLAEVQTREGSSIMVDLGETSATRSAQIRAGDSISVIGEVGRISGEPALFATEIAQTIKID